MSDEKCQFKHSQKTKHPSQEAAQAVIDRLRAEDQKRTGGWDIKLKTVRPFLCHKCNSWHIGSKTFWGKPKPKRNAWQERAVTVRLERMVEEWEIKYLKSLHAVNNNLEKVR